MLASRTGQLARPLVLGPPALFALSGLLALAALPARAEQVVSNTPSGTIRVVDPATLVLSACPPAEAVVAEVLRGVLPLLSREGLAERVRLYGPGILLQERRTRYTWGVVSMRPGGNVTFDKHGVDAAQVYYWPAAPEGQRTALYRAVSVFGEGAADETHFATAGLRKESVVYPSGRPPARADRPDLEPRPEEMAGLVARFPRLARMEEVLRTFFVEDVVRGVVVDVRRKWGFDIPEASVETSYQRFKRAEPDGAQQSLGLDQGRRAVRALLGQPLGQRLHRQPLSQATPAPSMVDSGMGYQVNYADQRAVDANNWHILRKYGR